MNLCTLLPWIIGLGSALLGGLIGWYLKNSKASDEDILEHPTYLGLNEQYQTSLSGHRTLQSSYSSLRADYDQHQSKYAAKEAELTDWSSRYGSLEAKHADGRAAQPIPERNRWSIRKHWL